MSNNMAGKICLVTGATRGIGKGIAAMLSKAGATVYITGRSVNKELQDEISAYGGQCIIAQCDHSNDEQVKNVFEKIKKEQNGRLDILVNNAYGGVAVIKEMRGKFYEEPISNWDIINNVGLRSNYVAAHHAANIMIPNKQGLIINISSAGGLQYVFNVPYGVGKAANDRMMADMAVELKKHNIAAVSMWPGCVSTEAMIDIIDGKYGERLARMMGMFKGAYIETPEFTGKAVLALGSDKNVMKKTGKILVVAELAKEYGFQDVGGIQPLSFRQVKFLVRRFYPSYEWMVPQFLYLPWWMIVIGTHKFG